jgi:hypothetical protein
MIDPLFLKALEDLASMVFGKLDPDLWHYPWFEHREYLDKIIGFLLMVYDIQHHTGLVIYRP